jgi:hypothetical protein
MGFLSSLFGSTGYSTTEHLLTTDDLNHLFWKTEHPNLTERLKHLVEESVLKHRNGSGKISLHRIYGLLLELEHQHLLNEFNRKDFLKIFKKYFDTHFKN